jgi:diamine N-acetyltransferase
MLERRPVAPGHIAALSALQVRKDQRDLVTANARTFDEAPVQPGAHVWGLWTGDVPVGLMAMIEPADVRHGGPYFDPRAAYLWRLMIAAHCQGQGFGATAMRMAVQTARDWHTPRLLLGVSDLPHSNRGFYERFGFRDTGLVEDGDRLMVLGLDVAAQTLPKLQTMPKLQTGPKLQTAPKPVSGPIKE